MGKCIPLFILKQTTLTEKSNLLDVEEDGDKYTSSNLEAARGVISLP